MGAWIETCLVAPFGNMLKVAPYMGAWIETSINSAVPLLMVVAPYMGAWIETANGAYTSPCVMSHPTWVRGLKQRTQNG